MGNGSEGGKIWMVRADNGESTELCVSGGFTGLGWTDLGDLTGVDDRFEIEERYRQVWPDEGSGKRRAVVGIHHRFLLEMRVGDWIITPEKDSRRLRIGTALAIPITSAIAQCPTAVAICYDAV